MSEETVEKKPAVECVRFGEILQIPMKDEKPTRFYIMNNCGHEQFPSYFCDSHSEKLANVGRLMEHITSCEGDTQPCRLVIYCKKHNYFERVSMAQQEGFKKAGFLG